MFTNSKIAIAAALILGTASAALAGSANTGKTHKASTLARGSYAQVLRPGPGAEPAPTVTPRPITSFEKNWFDYQNHTY